MKPDQHKKKRSAQYKKKHGITQKKEDGKSTNQEKTKLSSSSLSSSSSSSALDVKSPPTPRLPSSQSQHSHNKDSTDESERVRQFSRRKIESNWDRYEPLNEAQDDDRSSSDIRGADYESLISQTGDATSQFRFKDEQIWEEEDLGDGNNQESDSFPAIDCHALANQLRAIPLHIRLNIQENFFESSMLQSFNEIALRHEKELNSIVPATSVLPSTRSKASPLVLTGSQLTDSNTDKDTMAAKQSLQDKELHKMTPDYHVKSKESDAVQPGDLSSESNYVELVQPLDNNRTQNSSRDGGQESTAIRNTVLELESNDSARAICPKPASPTVASIGTDSQAEVKSSHTMTSNPLNDKNQCKDIKKDYLQPNSKTSEIEDEDELDFLLSLETPVQTRIKLGTNETAEGQEEEGSASTSQDSTEESSAMTIPVEASTQNDAKADDLEDWLDSILED
ncbi:cell death regulator Aven-like [Asterias rubens]|uniref:cell death regulator Aven-like n=1 Tax=Asterias rubens TaxID=7604 RepID=UPI00145524CA|nr:cell death regulator Aven-like [Asterias rubens]